MTISAQADKELRDANEEMIAEKEMQLRNMKAQPGTREVFLMFFVLYLQGIQT